jgi:hypothetical protein
MADAGTLMAAVRLGSLACTRWPLAADAQGGGLEQHRVGYAADEGSSACACRPCILHSSSAF